MTGNARKWAAWLGVVLVGLLWGTGSARAGLVALTATPTPSTTVTASPSPPAGPRYVVQPGDTLYGIATRFGVDLDRLMAVNGLGPNDVLYPGRELILPDLAAVSGYLYAVTVPFGEDWRSLARRYRLPPDEFVRLNRLVSPYQLYAGRPVIVPGDDTGPQAWPALARLQLGPGEGLLEAAARQGVNPWVLRWLNHLTGASQALADDVLFYPAADGRDQALGALPPEVRAVRWKPDPRVQGETWALFVTLAPAALPADAADQAPPVQGAWRTRPLHFAPWDDAPADDPAGRTFVALSGVHPLAWVEPHPLRLEGTLPDGRAWAFEQEQPIAAGDYGFEEITVPPEFLDATVAQAESARVADIMSGYTPTRYWDGPMQAPSPYGGDCINSLFGTRRSYNDGALWGYHAGVDLCGGLGTPIYAAADGVVVLAENLEVRGGAVILDHGWGVYTGYWHLSAIEVQPGQQVQAGDEIGLAGSTGRSTGPHLHWELWVGGVPVNPLAWLEQPWP